MQEYLEYLNNPFVAGLVAGLLVVGFAYLDVWWYERTVENSYYYRMFFLVSILVGVLVYLAGTNGGSLIQRGGGNGGELKALGENMARATTGGGKTIVQKLSGGGRSMRGGSLDIYTNPPDF